MSTIVKQPQRTQGLRTNVAQGDHVLINLQGPGVFVCADISKQGGASDLTFVSLDIDGRNVVNLSFAAMANIGLTKDNPYGLVLTNQGNLDNLTIGYPHLLAYERELKLTLQVREAGIVQLLANVVHGK
jgi:hypothetical protein